MILLTRHSKFKYSLYIQYTHTEADTHTFPTEKEETLCSLKSAVNGLIGRGIHMIRDLDWIKEWPRDMDMWRTLTGAVRSGGRSWRRNE